MRIWKNGAPKLPGAIMSGNVTHIEIGSIAGTKTSSFFENLFNWQFKPWGDGAGVFSSPTCNVGLHTKAPQPSMVVYFDVADIEDAVLRVASLGGKPSNISPEEAGFGRFCTCTDPEGVVFGLHQRSKAAS
jgi:uncharacterized protein